MKNKRAELEINTGVLVRAMLTGHKEQRLE
jgi:hypothetical protein